MCSSGKLSKSPASGTWAAETLQTVLWRMQDGRRSVKPADVQVSMQERNHFLNRMKWKLTETTTTMDHGCLKKVSRFETSIPFPNYLPTSFSFSMVGDDALTFDVVEVPVSRRNGFNTRTKDKNRSISVRSNRTPQSAADSVGSLDVKEFKLPT